MVISFGSAFGEKCKYADKLVQCLDKVLYFDMSHKSFAISSLTFEILSLIMFCSWHHIPHLNMPHMWAENSK